MEPEAQSVEFGVLLEAQSVEAEKLPEKAEVMLVEAEAEFVEVETNFAWAAELFVKGVSLCSKPEAWCVGAA